MTVPEQPTSAPAREAGAYPPVTDELLADIVRRATTVGNPLKIVLFGSQTRGDARPESDLDLFDH